MTDLGEPTILRCEFDGHFVPSLAVMTLAWPASVTSRRWRLPDGLEMIGPPPHRLGLVLLRQQANSYSLSVVWNEICLSWPDLSRGRIQESDLALVLDAIGTSLTDLLDQPAEHREEPQILRVA